MSQFFTVLICYLRDILPSLAFGFLLSGMIHELVPESLAKKALGGTGIRPILYSTLIGTVLPVCCWGSLPIAVSLRRKGANLGPVLAFLIATPATSVSALAVTYGVMGFTFAAYIFAAVILMGLGAGFMGNWLLSASPEPPIQNGECREGCCGRNSMLAAPSGQTSKLRGVMRYAFVTMPKDIGLELVAGLLLAAAVSTVTPLQHLIHSYLAGWKGYGFSVVFGILTYLCSTASVPFVDSLIKQGLASGAGMTLLLIGPVTSYGTLFVLKKQFGMKILAAFLTYLTAATLLLGMLFGQMVR